MKSKKRKAKYEDMTTKINITISDDHYNMLKSTSKDQTELLTKIVKFKEKKIHITKGLVGGVFKTPRR